jgi:hypothetical protein
MQPVSSANIVLYYAAKVSAKLEAWNQRCSIVNGTNSVVLLVAIISLTIVIDYYCRRKSIFVGHISMGTCLVIVASTLVIQGSPDFDATRQTVQFYFRKVAAGTTPEFFMFLFMAIFGESAARFHGPPRVRSFQTMDKQECVPRTI